MLTPNGHRVTYQPVALANYESAVKVFADGRDTNMIVVVELRSTPRAPKVYNVYHRANDGFMLRVKPWYFLARQKVEMTQFICAEVDDIRWEVPAA